MLLISYMSRKITSHWQPLFSKKMAAAGRRPHFPTKLAAVASFSSRSNSMAFIASQLETLSMIEQPV